MMSNWTTHPMGGAGRGGLSLILTARLSPIMYLAPVAVCRSRMAFQLSSVKGLSCVSWPFPPQRITKGPVLKELSSLTSPWYSGVGRMGAAMVRFS